MASGLAASTIASTAAVLALPVLALPAILGGLAAPRGLIQTLYVGVAGFVAFAVLSAAAFGWDAPLRIAGRAARWLIQRVKPDSAADLPERLLAQRNRMKETFGRRWYVALTGAVGKVGFDYVALVCCLAAVGARPHPSLVLLAYVGGALLALIPVTPGGLGFVEAGLTGLLTAAGVGAQEALVSTLAYRLVSFWLPLPVGGIAYLLFRRATNRSPTKARPRTRRRSGRAPPACARFRPRRRARTAQPVPAAGQRRVSAAGCRGCPCRASRTTLRRPDQAARRRPVGRAATRRRDQPSPADDPLTRSDLPRLQQLDPSALSADNNRHIADRNVVPVVQSATVGSASSAAATVPNTTATKLVSADGTAARQSA